MSASPRSYAMIRRRRYQGTFGVGFGRLEMRVDERDPIALPAFTLEGAHAQSSEIMSFST